MNRRYRPSGDQRGAASVRCSPVSGRALPPSSAIAHTRLRGFGVSVLFASPTTHASRRPSGEIWGSETSFRSSRSASVTRGGAEESVGILAPPELERDPIAEPFRVGNRFSCQVLRGMPLRIRLVALLLCPRGRRRAMTMALRHSPRAPRWWTGDLGERGRYPRGH